ncbi:hypothetical protein F5I97DRAFT_1842877 [Phlebopus sp. FC_14]|nr:hypothetical protein F5I97DRAFT_1842877 [Phlebopus sp. FC_14]
MILGTLGRIRSKHAVSSRAARDDTNASGTDTGLESDYTPERSSHLSNTTASTTYPASSITSSPSSRSTKRYSNNLFSSGRFREYSYLRTVSQRSGSHRSAVSITHTESSQSLREETSLNSSEGVRPSTPEGSGPTSSVISSPNEKTPVARSASLLSSNEDPPPPTVGSDSGVLRSETLGSASIERASAALERVIREFEEEVEDEIVMPRTAHPVPRHGDADHARVGDDTRDLAGSGTSNQSSSPTSYEAGTAISSDKQITIESDARRLSPLPYGRSGTTSPTPRLPGYIPGMPRPMTPHDSAFDSDDIRSHSTTPRAMSPMLPNHNGHPFLSSGLLRRGSDASRSTPRPTFPQSHPTASSYLSRSNSGRRTPDANQRDSTSGTEQETSSVFVRRRPISPLSGPAFQPMAVSPRPSTPSNVTWNVGPSASPDKTKLDTKPTHSRSGSLSTEGEPQTNMDVNRSRSPSRSLLSPAPPDSPAPGQQTASTYKWNRSASPAFTSPSSYDPGTPPYLSSRSFRSPTPTQSRTAASPTFPSDSNGATVRSPKQRFKSPSNHSFGVSQLSFTPLGNSSRSSFESTGSSYHSWDPSQNKQVALEVFNGGTGPSQPVWHDLDKSSSTTPGSSQEDCDFEDIIRRYVGLTKSDFVAIQDKLVGAALQKAAYPDTRERTNSLRRRRPSTSQSNYSVNGREYGVASPPPSQVTPADRRSPADNSAKANALLESVVGSIPLTNITTDSKVENSAEPEASPTTRRNRDLARALGFGNELERLVVPILSNQEASSPTISPTVEAILPQEPSPVVEDTTSAKLPEAQSTPTLSPGPLPQRSQSMRNPRPTPINEAELAKEVQRKVDAATAALMKTSSGQKFSEINSSTISVTRKRISPSQISTPRLLSAPTSVETIPLPQPNPPQQPVGPQTSLGITERMRRFRNTLRAKPMVPMGDEITPFPIDLQPQSAPPQRQPLTRRPTLPLPKFGPGSSTDLGKLKTPNLSPPTSTTPGLKGLMARFRRPRTENTGDSQSSVHSRTSPTTSSPTASSHQGHTRANTTTSTSATAQGVIPWAESSARPSVDATTVTSDVDSVAVRQLFEAASNLGLDQAALNDLLTRSTSVSRIGGWGMPGGSSAIIGSQAPTSATRAGHNVDRNRPVTPSDKHPSDEALNGAGDKTVRKLSVRKLGESSQTRQSRQTPENSAVIRRTLIFPSEFRASKVDLNQVTRKSSTRRHRRSGSATSAQSAHHSPPVPSVPTSIAAQAEALLRAPPSNISAEKSNSAYESLYDMYSGESKHTSTVLGDAGTEHGDDAAQEGPALEVVEMANGETIWSIVNGLRDDDVESLYASRTSLGSEYSTRENGDGLQIFVKEHARSTSKGSTSSFLSRKKSSQGKNRPETKVFYSSSAHIGRLIENLSQGMDAGSFNFIPNQPPDRSTPSSFHSDGDTHWTVEERLEHMLGTIRNSNS